MMNGHRSSAPKYHHRQIDHQVFYVVETQPYFKMHESKNQRTLFKNRTMK